MYVKQEFLLEINANSEPAPSDEACRLRTASK